MLKFQQFCFKKSFHEGRANVLCTIIDQDSSDEDDSDFDSEGSPFLHPPNRFIQVIKRVQKKCEQNGFHNRSNIVLKNLKEILT